MTKAAKTLKNCLNFIFDSVGEFVMLLTALYSVFFFLNSACRVFFQLTFLLWGSYTALYHSHHWKEKENGDIIVTVCWYKIVNSWNSPHLHHADSVVFCWVYKPASDSPYCLSWCSWCRWAAPRSCCPLSSPPPVRFAQSALRCQRQRRHRGNGCRNGRSGGVVGWQRLDKGHSRIYLQRIISVFIKN